MSDNGFKYDFSIKGEEKLFVQFDFSTKQDGNIMTLHSHLSKVKITISVFENGKYSTPINRSILCMKSGYDKFVMILENRSSLQKDESVLFLIFSGKIKATPINTFEIPVDKNNKSTRDDPKYSFKN